MPRAISNELARFIESGVSIQVGTRDARLFPEGIRAFGVRVERGRREVTIFVPDATGATTLANVADNGLMAVCFARIADHRSIQVKGRVVSVQPAKDDERALVERYRGELQKKLGEIGLPSRISLRFNVWPCHAVRVRIESVFVQTPGPGAGAPLEAAAGDTR